MNMAVTKKNVVFWDMTPRGSLQAGKTQSLVTLKMEAIYSSEPHNALSEKTTPFNFQGSC
jgi:hypothetical protein